MNDFQGWLRRRPWIDALLILALALVLRCGRLDALPPGLDRDAAANGLYALDLTQRGIWPFFVLHMGVAEPLMVYLQAISVALLGSTVTALRLVSALVGALTAAAVYGWVRVWWGERPDARAVALLAGVGLALCPVHVHLSRLGLRAILFPLLQIVVLAALWRGWKTGCWPWFAAAGAALGLGMYSYLAFRALFLILPLLVLVLYLGDRPMRRAQGVGLLVMAGCAALLVLPAAPFFYRYPAALWGRAGQVSVWQLSLAVERGVGYALAAKLWAQVKMLGLEWRGQYNDMGFPLLDPLWLAAFAVGLVNALRRFKQPAYALLLLGLPAMLLPDLLSDRLLPHELRVLGVFPFVFVLAGHGLAAAAAWMFEIRQRYFRMFFHRYRNIISMAGLVLVSAGSLLRLSEYVFVWTPQAQRSGAHLHLTELAEAEFVQTASLPLLMPLAEYERSVLRYVSGSAFPARRSALDEHGQWRPGLLDGRVRVLIPDQPDRPRLEGPTFAFDAAQYALFQDGTVYLLPPLDAGSEARVRALGAIAPLDHVFDANGRHVAAVYAWPAGLSFIDRPAHALHISLGGRVALLGYTLSDWRLRPGDEATVALFWQAERKMDKNYTLFVHLIDRQGAVWAFGDTTPGQGTYPTTYWRLDELVPTFHRLAVPENLPPGRYEVEVGWFDPLDGSRLPVLDTGGQAVDSRVLLAPLKAARPPVDPAGERAWQPVGARLGGVVSLNGGALEGQSPEQWVARPGERLALWLWWTALAQPAADAHYFVHLADQDERIWAQVDAAPLGGAYPTGIWEAGENIVEQVDLVIPADAPPGWYQLWTGMYDPSTQVRWPAADAAGQRAPDDRVGLGQVWVGP